MPQLIDLRHQFAIRSKSKPNRFSSILLMIIMSGSRGKTFFSAIRSVLMSIAKLAAERFGSYSSDTHNFENLRDMKYLMTDKMKQQTDDLIDGLLIDNSLPQEYYGVTTNALSVKIISHNKKQDVEVVVPCQKVETKGRDNPISKTKYQSARIKMLYVNEKWLVDELQWE